MDSDHAPAYANTTRVLLDRHAFQAQIRAALRWSSHCSDKSTSAASLGDVLAMLSGVEMVLRANAEDTATDTQGSHRAAIAADLANGIIATAATMVVELSTYSSDSQACRHKSSIIDTFGGVVVRLFQLVCDSNDSNVVSETRRAVTAAFQRALPEVVGALVKLTERFLDALLREDDLSPTHSHSHTMDGDDHRRLVRCLLAIAAHELELGRSIAVAAITHIIKEIHAFPGT